MADARKPAICRSSADPERQYEQLRQLIVKSCGIKLPRPAEWITAFWRQYMKM
ncbi:hypothetical protein OC845_006790, partial [Tilletia horrida]